MAETAQADDADFLAGADLPVAQRRISGDARAQQRRDGGKIALVMRHLEHEFLPDDDMVRIAAEGVAARDGIRAVIGADEAGGFAILLLALLARRAMAAAVDHAATPTKSPTANLATSPPIAVTRPTISWPGTHGYCVPPHSPRAVCRSEWHTPQNRMSIATSPAPGVRRVKLNGASGVVADCAAKALAVLVMMAISILAGGRISGISG